MNEKIETKPITLTPFKRFCMTIGELPTSYLETMSYYEMLLWFTKYLSDTVIPAIDNNAEALKEVQNLFLELQDYVNNYFDNLDISSEVNAKLDEMAESGQLQEIMADYLEAKAIFGFDTIADMKNAENLIDGSFAKTYGSNNLHDGIGYFYKVREVLNTDEIDELNLIALHDQSLVAERISSYVIGDTKNPIYYGADPTGTNDSAQAINECIQANKGSSIEFSIGTYLVNSTINLPYGMDEKVNINGNGATLKNTEDLTCLINVGFDKGTESANDVGFVSYIKDLNIDGSESDTTYCIDIVDGFKDLKLFNLRIFRFLNGVRIGTTSSSPADVLLTDSLLYGKGSEYDGVGVISNCTDNNIEMCRIYGFRKGFENYGSCVINQCHVLLRWEHQTSANYDPYARNGVEWNQYYPLTTFIESHHGCRIYNSVCDSMYKFLDIKTTENISVINNSYYNARDNVNMRVFDFNGNTTGNTIIKNNEIWCSHYNEGVVIYNTSQFDKFAQLIVKNNILRRMSNITNPGDIILSSVQTTTTASYPFIQDTWYVVKVISNTSPWTVINGDLFLGNWPWKIRIDLDVNGNVSDIHKFNSGSGESRWLIGAVKDGQNLYLCAKSVTDNFSTKAQFKITYSSEPTFCNYPLNVGGSNMVQSSKLLSDYTQNVPTVTERLYNVQS